MRKVFKADGRDEKGRKLSPTSHKQNKMERFKIFFKAGRKKQIKLISFLPI